MNNLNWNKVYLKMKCCVYFIFGNENSTQTMMRMMHAKSYYNNDVRFLCYIFIWYASKSMNSILNNANSFFVIVSTQLMRNRSIYARCSSHLIRQGMCVSTSLWFTKNRLWFKFNLYNFSLHYGSHICISVQVIFCYVLINMIYYHYQYH